MRDPAVSPCLFSVKTAVSPSSLFIYCLQLVYLVSPQLVYLVIPQLVYLVSPQLVYLVSTACLFSKSTACFKFSVHSLFIQ